ncbi:hypothetical protein [Roseibium sp.]
MRHLITGNRSIVDSDDRLGSNHALLEFADVQQEVLKFLKETLETSAR